MGALLSFGQDPRWRRFLVTRIPLGTPRVLDVATGTAAVALQIVTRDADVRVVGLDQNREMLAEAHVRVGRRGKESRIALVRGQGERLPFEDDAFDAVTFTYLLRYVDSPQETLRELARVLRPGGTIANLEFAVPPQPWTALWWLYTRVGLPLLGRVSSRAWYDVGRFLGPSISGFARRYPPAAQRAMWEAAGFVEVRQRGMSLGGGLVTWAVKPA